MKFNHLLNSIETTHVHFQEVAAKAINRSLTIRNWMIGCYIVEYEQKGVNRARYGAQLLEQISKALPMLKLSPTNLKLCRQFYQYYPQINSEVSVELKNSAFQIHQSMADEFEKINMRIRQSVTDELQSTDSQLNRIRHTVSDELGTSNNPIDPFAPGDNPPIGILLVTNKDEALAEYAIPSGMDQQMFISTYAVQLPTKEQLQQFLAGELRRCES